MSATGSSNSNLTMSRASILAASFPFKVFKILEHIDLAAPQWKTIISWSNHGRSFRVHNRKKFEAEIMPLYFKTRHYESFRKQLSIWGFKRINGVRHPDCGSYYNELFLRGNPSLCGKIERNAKSKADERGWSFPMQEPDFSSMQPMPQSNGEPAAVGSNEQVNAISSSAIDTAVDTKPGSSDNSFFTNGFTPNSYTSGGSEISSQASQNRPFSNSSNYSDLQNPTLQQQFHPPTTTSASSPGLPSMMPQAQIPQAQQMPQMPDPANNTASVFTMLMNQLPSDQRQLLQQQIIAQLGANAQSIMNTNTINSNTNNMVAVSASASPNMMQRTPSPNDAPNMMNNTQNNMLQGSSPNMMNNTPNMLQRSSPNMTNNTPNNMLQGSSSNNFVLNAVPSNSEVLQNSGVSSPTNNMIQRTPSTNDASSMMNNMNEMPSSSNHLLRRSTSNNFNTSSMSRTGSNNNMLKRTTSNTTIQSHMLRRSTSNSLMPRTASQNTMKKSDSSMMNNMNEMPSASNHLLRRSTSNNFNTSSMSRTGSNNNMLNKTTSNTTMQSHMLRRSTSNSLMPRTASQNTIKKSDSFLSKRKLMSQTMERSEVQQHSLEGSKRSKNNLLSYSRSTSQDVGNVKRHNSTPVFGQTSFHLSRSRKFDSRVNAKTSANDEDGSKSNFDWYGSSNRSSGDDTLSELKDFDTASILRDRSARNPLLSKKSASAFELNQQSGRSSHSQRHDNFGSSKRNGSAFDIVENSDTNRQENTQNASIFDQQSSRLANNPFLQQLSSNGKLSSIGSTNTFGSSSDLPSGNDVGASLFEQHSSRLANNPFLQQLSSNGSINRPGSLTDLEPHISIPTMENRNNTDVGRVSGQNVYQKQSDLMDSNPFLQMTKTEANFRENMTGGGMSDFGASFGLNTLNEEQLYASFETKSNKSNGATNSELSASGSLRGSSDHLRKVDELFKGYKELESAVSQTQRDSRTDMLRRFKEISSISAQSIQSINTNSELKGYKELESAVSQTQRDSRNDMLRRFQEISSISAQSIQSINSDFQIEGLSVLTSDPKQLRNVFDDSST